MSDYQAVQLDKFIIKRVDKNDSLEELTELINSAYKEYLDYGADSLGVYQTIEMTRKRITDGECYIALYNDQIIGTFGRKF